MPVDRRYSFDDWNPQIIAVTATAIQILSPALAGREKIYLRASGATTIYVAPTAAGCEPATGLPITSSLAVTLELDEEAVIYAGTGSGGAGTNLIAVEFGNAD